MDKEPREVLSEESKPSYALCCASPPTAVHMYHKQSEARALRAGGSTALAPLPTSSAGTVLLVCMKWSRTGFLSTRCGSRSRTEVFVSRERGLGQAKSREPPPVLQLPHPRHRCPPTWCRAGATRMLPWQPGARQPRHTKKRAPMCVPGSASPVLLHP